MGARAQNNHWTGGQYSLVRAAFGYALAIVFLADGEVVLARSMGEAARPLVPTAIVAALMLAVGKFERAAAIFLTGVCAIAGAGTRGVGIWDALAVVALTHACIPSAPFGSWSAAGRVDPRGTWRMPPAVYSGAWLVMIAGYAYSAWTRGPVAWRVLDVALAALSLIPAARAPGWAATLVLSVVRATILRDPSGLDVGLLCLHALTFDPRWIPPRAGTSGVERVHYDGECGLCHRFVRFVLAEDTRGVFRFAPLQGDSFRALALSDADLPDSVVIESESRVLLRSNAALHVLDRLGGVWRALAIVARAVPWRLRDVVYDAVARVRRALFRTPASTCPTMPPDLAARFDP